MSRLSFRDRVAAYFTAQPLVWIDGRTLETIGGHYAWRSRVSDRRRELGMDIQNRQRKIGGVTVSEYQYVPPVERQGEPHTADVNAWSLR